MLSGTTAPFSMPAFGAMTLRPTSPAITAPPHTKLRSKRAVFSMRVGGRVRLAVMKGQCSSCNSKAAPSRCFDLVAPPTFTIVVQQAGLDQLLADEEAGIELSRVVHGEQGFALARPIVAGDELTVHFRVTSIRALGGNSMVGTEARIVDASGETVATATSSLVVGATEGADA